MIPGSSSQHEFARGRRLYQRQKIIQAYTENLLPGFSIIRQIELGIKLSKPLGQIVKIR